MLRRKATPAFVAQGPASGTIRTRYGLVPVLRLAQIAQTFPSASIETVLAGVAPEQLVAISMFSKKAPSVRNRPTVVPPCHGPCATQTLLCASTARPPA